MTSSLSLFLVQSIACSSLILSLVFLINFLARKAPADLRHFVWVIAIGLILFVPPAAFLLPKLDVPFAAAFDVSALGSTNFWPIDPLDPLAYSRAPAVAIGTENLMSTLAQDNHDRRLGLYSFVAFSYLLITAMLLLRLARRLAVVRAWVDRMKPYRDADTLTIVATVAASMGINRSVRILDGAEQATPWAWGVFKPVVVVPGNFRNWSREERTNALVHEFAHIKRFDFLTMLLGQLSVTLNWFQPLIWLANRAMCREAEYACDDQVTAFGASGSDYASQLLRTAHAIAGLVPPSHLVSAMAGRSDLASRITRILDSTIRRTAVSQFTRYSVLSVGILLAAPLVALRSQPAAEAILVSGPSTEAELELLIDALVESGQEERARASYVDWFAASSNSFEGCHSCIALLDGTDASETSAKKRLILRSAFDDIETLARSQANPEPLMRMVGILANVAQMKDLGSYYLLQARALADLSDAQELNAAIFLASSGQYVAGLTLIQQLHTDPQSDYFQSPTTSRWISYMDSRQALMDRIERQLSDESAVVAASYEYMPAYKESPLYPAAARESRMEGEVTVRYTVTSTGQTSDATVVESSNGLFDESALASVANYRYLPRIQNGVAMDVPGVSVKILYRLDQ